MTITNYDNRRQYSGDGSTTTFSFSPPFTTQTDLVVQVQAADGSLTTKVLGTDYIISGPPYTAGGTVTMAAAPALTTTLIIYRDVSLTQPVDLQDGGPLPAGTVNRALDRITMWGQRLREMADRAFANATQTMAGLMSATDKYKLDNIEAGAQVNVVTSVAGKTGTVSLFKADVGLGNVDNTSDVNKPVSTAQAAADALALKVAQNLNDLSSKATARANLGVAIGTDVQAFNARLADIAGIAWQQGDVLYHNGTALVRLAAGTSGQFLRTSGVGANPVWASVPGGGDMLRANNLSDVANAATARANIGAGTGNGSVTSVAMTVPSFLSISGGPITTGGTLTIGLSGTALPIANGGTGLTAVGADGTFLTSQSGTASWVSIQQMRAPDLWVQDERATGTSGDASSTSAGVFVPATLNTVKRNVIAGASVASNIITLPAGVYYAKWKNPLHAHASSAQGSSQQKTRLRDVTNNITLGVGDGNSFSSGAPDILATLLSLGTAYFTLSAPATVALHRVSPTHASTMFGVATGFAEVEVYAVLEIWKVS
ncbi:hypothetical protein [Labrys neptuniae]